MAATMRRRQAQSVRDCCSIAMSAALLAVCSWLSVPVGSIPITLQTFAVFLIAGLLGFRRTAAALGVWLALGAVGVPVFSGFRSGAGAILGVTGGYMLGFFATAAVVALSRRLFGRKLWALAAGMAVGCLVCYALGTAWFLLVYARSGGPVSVLTVLGMCVLPYLLPDAVKLVLAAVLTNRLADQIRL